MNNYLDLYIHSFDVTYTTNLDFTFFFPVIFPDNVTVPANSLVNIDMKLRVNLFSNELMSYLPNIFVVPNDNLVNTPLIQALTGKPVNDGVYAADLFIAVRNVSNNSYTIPSGTSLFNIYTGLDEPMVIHQVTEDHLTMEVSG